jgi:hypothetical protein
MDAPHPKVVASAQGSTVGGALALILVWALNTYTNAKIPAEVGVAIGTIFSAVLAFAAGYCKPDRAA